MEEMQKDPISVQEMGSFIPFDHITLALGKGVGISSGGRPRGRCLELVRELYEIMPGLSIKQKHAPEDGEE
jgi:hypothetical protein